MKENIYTLDNSFLDTVFKFMYESRGTYQDVFRILEGVEQILNKKIRYNDVLMCLDQLAKDGFVTHEGLSNEQVPIFRLSYQGFIAFDSESSKTPYQSSLRRKKLNKSTSKLKTTLIAINAIAILIITGLQVYFDQKDSLLETNIQSMEQKIKELVKENNELKTVLNRKQETTVSKNELEEDQRK